MLNILKTNEPTKEETKIPVCLDTGMIYGMGQKLIRKIKINAKPAKKLKEIKDEGILDRVYEKSNFLFVTIITSYEFLRKLSKSEGVSLELTREVYQKVLEEFKIVEIIPRKDEINLSPALMNRLCDYDLDLADGLHLYIASKRNLPFITSEKKKLPAMKRFYDKTMSAIEFLNLED